MAKTSILFFYSPSPISDTTVLSSLACDCDLLAHVSTQAPYALLTSLLAILCGTLPIGYGVWPNIVSFIIGWLLTGVCVYLICRRVVNANGSFSPVLELWLRFVKKGNSDLEILRIDTVKFYQDEQVGEQTFGSFFSWLPWRSSNGSPEDDLGKTKDVSEGEEALDYDEETPGKAKEVVDEMEAAEEAVPVDDSTVNIHDSMVSEHSVEA